MSGVAHLEVGAGEAGMRLDRWLRAHYPKVGFGHAQKLIRSGQIRIDGARAKGETRLEVGQTIRVPPLAEAGPAPREAASAEDRERATAMVLRRDDHLVALNKPPGLPTQGGSGVADHVDRLLPALVAEGAEPPRLVHRLDRDTSGVLLVALTRRVAASLAAALRTKRARKLYWALVKGVPRPSVGRISTYLAPEGKDGQGMRLARHGAPGAVHAVTRYRVLDRAGDRIAWVALAPETGRKHQLRVHMAHIGHPILGDGRYLKVQNWQPPGGVPAGLMLHARRIAVPHPAGGVLDVTAPPPEAFAGALAALGFAAAGEADLFEEEGS